MKTLSLHRPLIVMVAGLPGAGKSFFAKQFAEMFNVPCVRYDKVRSDLFGKPQFTTDENDIVGRIAYYMIGELTKTGRSFLVDGGCDTRAARLQLEQVAKLKGYGTLVIWVQTDPATARSRAQKRNPKKPDDAENVSLTATQFDDFSKRFAVPTKEEHVVISGRHAYSTQARTVLKKLAAPHTEALQNSTDRKVRQVATIHRPAVPKLNQPRRGVVIR